MNDVRTLMIAVGIGMLAAAPGPVKFREQEIAKDFGVGYAVAAGDVNGDKKTDILAISGTELVWFQAPNWEKTVILAAGATTADNVTIAPHDIDGDGRLDVALGAGWTRQNTGTLQWVRQNAPGTTPAWEVFPISAEPTLHRIKWADVDGDRKLELIVAPLHGKGTTNAQRPRRAPAGLQAAGESEDRPVADGGRRRGEPHPAQLPADEPRRRSAGRARHREPRRTDVVEARAATARGATR